MSKSIFKPQSNAQRLEYLDGIKNGTIPSDISPNAFFAMKPKDQKKVLDAQKKKLEAQQKVFGIED